MLGEERLPVVDGVERGYDFLTLAALQHPQYYLGASARVLRGCDRVLAGKLGTVIGGGLGSSPVPPVVPGGLCESCEGGERGVLSPGVFMQPSLTISPAREDCAVLA